jgi:hypothetical protein
MLSERSEQVTMQLVAIIIAVFVCLKEWTHWDHRQAINQHQRVSKDSKSFKNHYFHSERIDIQ